MNKTKLWIAVGLLIAVILLLFMCRKNKTAVLQKPTVVTVPEIKKIVTRDTVAYNRLRDSFTNVLLNYKLSLRVKESDLQNQQDKTLELQQYNDYLLSQLKGSELTSQVIDQADKIKRNGEIKDSTFASITTNLNNQLSVKGKELEECEKLAKRINSALDTCLKNQTALNSFADKVKPTNKLAVGLVANVYPYAGVGFGSDFITKKNMIYSGSGTYMQKNWYIQIGVKKIISFK